MNADIRIQLLTTKHITEISALGQQLNPKLSLDQLKTYQAEMFEMDNYNCFGLFYNSRLVGISSGWITVRYYSGKQLEVDNVVIDASLQSRGLGKQFFEFIENWARENGCNTVELNTYVQNSRSHKFYHKLGYSILGFHFLKKLV